LKETCPCNPPLISTTILPLPYPTRRLSQTQPSYSTLLALAKTRILTKTSGPHAYNTICPFKFFFSDICGE